MKSPNVVSEYSEPKPMINRNSTTECSRAPMPVCVYCVPSADLIKSCKYVHNIHDIK